jgi:hypothetical protein
MVGTLPVRSISENQARPQFRKLLATAMALNPNPGNMLLKGREIGPTATCGAVVEAPAVPSMIRLPFPSTGDYTGRGGKSEIRVSASTGV